MKINTFFNYNPANLYRNNLRNKNRVAKRIAPYILAGSMILGGYSSGFAQKVTGKNNSNGAKIEYYSIKSSTRDELISLYSDFKSKLNDDNDFLKDVTLILTKKYSDMKGSGSFKEFLKSRSDLGQKKGLSFYSDNKIPKYIVIQENAHSTTDIMYNLAQTGSTSKLPILKHSLMHEIGHQFDEYFGHEHDAKYAQSYDSVLYEKELNPFQNPYSCVFSPKDRIIINFYNDNNTLSDSKEFKDAYLKDLYNVAKIQKSTPGYLPVNIGYYTKGIDFAKELTTVVVDASDFGRCETYANLFAYAMDENDGDKKDFIKAFPNCYEVVKNDIKTYLGDGFVK